MDIQESRLPMRARMTLTASGRGRSWAAAALVLGLVAAGTWIWLARGRSPAATAAVPAAMAVQRDMMATTAPTEALAKSVAVLAFVDLSAAHDQEYLSDGVTEELINTLARVPGLRVAGRTSAFAYKGRNVGATVIGRELQVGKIIEGSVRRTDARVRIAVRMTNAADGFQLWSETFEREAKDLLTLQVEIARTVAQKLQLALNGGVRESVERLATDSPDAYALFLRGRQLLARRGSETGEAQRLFEGAIAADEYYASAYSGVAECHLLRAYFGRVAPTEAMPLVRTAADRARELDPQLADAYAALGFVRLFHEWDTRAAEEMLQRALERNADHVGALAWRAVARLNRGDSDAALALTARATEADPLSPMANALRGWVNLLVRRPDDAKTFLEKARALDPDFALAPALLGEQAEMTRDLAGALALYEAGLARMPGNALLLAHRARVKGLLGRTDEAQVAVTELIERGRRSYVRAYLLAVAQSGLGDKSADATLEALERAVAERDLGIATLRHVPTFEAVRSHPRYQRLDQSVGDKLWSSRVAR